LVDASVGGLETRPYDSEADSGIFQRPITVRGELRRTTCGASDGLDNVGLVDASVGGLETRAYDDQVNSRIFHKAHHRSW